MSRSLRVHHVVAPLRRARVAHQTPIRYVTSPARSNPTRSIQRPGTSVPPPAAPHRGRALAWVITSLLAGGIAFYGGALLVAARQPCRNPGIADLAQQKDVSARYDDTADGFDSEVGFSEFLMGINRTRKQLARKCTGAVLEVSCGTGRNLGYYDIGKKSDVTSLTLVDLSPQMIEVCKKKWDILVGKNKSLRPGLVIRFLTASALDTMPPAPNKQKYDTIIQTMGLCSTPLPSELLLNMIEHLDISNPEAKILLLEHGRSYRDWLNNILDNAAEKHAEIHGCWFNRDIGALVSDAARESGLEVVSEKRHHFGTTWVFELKPSAELVQRSVAPKAETPEQSSPSSWRSWFGLG